MTGLHIAPGLTLPLEAVTETFAILAVKRAGKSNAAVVMAEEMYDAGVPWVAVDPKGDWWGVRAAGDGESPGLSVLVFGGLHGDVPLEPTAGRLVADLVAEKRLTCVLDVSEMSKADQRRFLAEFADRLYRRNTEPLHVFCEEADEYIPQMVRGEAAKVVAAFETLVKRGGFRGIGITLVTQRSASLNKDVLTQAGTLIAMRTPSPQDRKAVLAWIDYHAASRDVVDQLPELEAGEAWVFSPQWLKTLEKIRFRRRRTFDSGATPKVGGKPRPPARLADVDLAAIKEEMAETIERAKADDPRELRRQIASLDRQILSLERDLAAKPIIETLVERVEVPVLDRVTLEAFGDTVDQLLEVLRGIERQLQQYPSKLPTEGKQGQPTTRSSAPRANQTSSITGRAPVAGSSTTREMNPPAGQETRPDPAGGPVKLGKTEQRVLTVLAQHGPRTHRQLALQAGYSAKSSTIGVAISKLRKAGYVEPGGQGMPFEATQTGLELAAGSFDPLPTGAALLDYWRGEFGKTENAVLEVLLDTYPDDMAVGEIAERAGYSPASSTTGVALSKLRRVALVDKGWRISDEFAQAIGLTS